MQKISERSNRLQWSQPSAMRTEYELRSEGATVGSLKLVGVFRVLATAVSGDESWTFKRVGFFQNRTIIRKSGSDADIAVFRKNTWSSTGELEFAGGRRFKATTNFWMTRFAFLTESGEPLLSFRYRGFLRRSGDVEVTAEARKLPELPLLVLFGWYLMVMFSRDGAVAASSS